MTEKKLAKELRKRQIKFGKVPAETIKLLSDKAIIDSYITCNICKEKEVPDSILPWIINKATNADHFFTIIDQIKEGMYNKNKHRKNNKNKHNLREDTTMYTDNYDEERKEIIQTILNDNGLDTELPESQIPFYVMDQIYDALWERDQELEYEFMREQEEEMEAFENENNNNEDDDEDEEIEGPERN
jgi:hypothetical protein